MLPFHRIVCATEFDEPSRQALVAAIEMARHFEAQLCLVHIVDASPLISYYPDPLAFPMPPIGSVISPSEIQENLSLAAQKQLDDLAAQEVPPGVPVRCIVSCGDPVTEIQHIVSQEKGDLLVLGTHGRTGLHRLLCGSVVEEEIRRALCPVMVIHVSPSASQTEDEANEASAVLTA